MILALGTWNFPQFASSRACCGVAWNAVCFNRRSLNKAIASSTFVFLQLHLLCDRSAMRLLTTRHNIDVDWYNLAEEGKLDILRKVSSDFNTFWWISG